MPAWLERLVSNLWTTAQVVGFIAAPGVIFGTLMMPTVLVEPWMWLLSGFCGYCVWEATRD